MKFTGKIDKRQITIVMQDLYNRFLDRLDGKLVDIWIEEHKDTRSAEQNRLYWKILTAMSLQSGHDKVELHEMFKRRFLLTTIEFCGSIYEIPRSTKSLKVGEMSEYIDRVIQVAAENGITLELIGEL